jgi:hypothetical protein
MRAGPHRRRTRTLVIRRSTRVGSVVGWWGAAGAVCHARLAELAVAVGPPLSGGH